MRATQFTRPSIVLHSWTVDSAAGAAAPGGQRHRTKVRPSGAKRSRKAAAGPRRGGRSSTVLRNREPRLRDGLAFDPCKRARERAVSLVTGLPRRQRNVVAPSLTPDSYNQLWCHWMPPVVVAPSLTPDSYNLASAVRRAGRVVAPSLTPDSYNLASAVRRAGRVVAPSLTPDSYNGSPTLSITTTVVAPSLTPDSYNPFVDPATWPEVVAPSLTPDSYNSRKADLDLL